mmetsp:Transcript_16994/g.27108  ORF Transcript_16994/g.27108 Transcript_16994/m.27108 type:complete len:89 (-) Transcript_16994:145-411(-)
MKCLSPGICCYNGMYSASSFFFFLFFMLHPCRLLMLSAVYRYKWFQTPVVGEKGGHNTLSSYHRCVLLIEAYHRKYLSVGKDRKCTCS